VIFVTVGTQLAFDRLIVAVDQWAARNPGTGVFAQVGPGDYRPAHIHSTPFISPVECRERMRSADVIVAHAGMGTILSALELGKPLLVMPRRAALGEHRNDHQLATAARFAAAGRIAVATDTDELGPRLDELDARDAGERISRYASPELLGALTSFING